MAGAVCDPRCHCLSISRCPPVLTVLELFSPRVSVTAFSDHLCWKAQSRDAATAAVAPRRPDRNWESGAVGISHLQSSPPVRGGIPVGPWNAQVA